MVVVVLVAVPEAQVGVEAAIRRRVLLLEEAQVPLAHGVRGVAQSAQSFRKQSLVERKTPRFRFQDHEMLHP